MQNVKKKIKYGLVKLCQRLGETSPILMDFSAIEDGQNALALLETMRTARYLMPVEIDIPSNKKVLIIAPHPDDEVIGMGGMLAKMVANNCSVDVVYLSFGLDEVTRKEAQSSADLLGYKCTHFFDYKPKNIPLDEATIKIFAQQVNNVSPDVICLPFMLDDHDDHRRASEFLLRAIDQNLINSSNDVHILAYQVYTMLPLNAVVNITEVLDQKLQAIRKYQSRFVQRDWAHFAKGLNAFNVRYLPGNINEDYAELFLSVSLPNYIKTCRTYFENAHENCYSNENYK